MNELSPKPKQHPLPPSIGDPILNADLVCTLCLLVLSIRGLWPHCLRRCSDLGGLSSR